MLSAPLFPASGYICDSARDSEYLKSDGSINGDSHAIFNMNAQIRQKQISNSRDTIVSTRLAQ